MECYYFKFIIITLALYSYVYSKTDKMNLNEKALVPLYIWSVRHLKNTQKKTTFWYFLLQIFSQSFHKNIFYWVKESTILRASHPTSNVDLQGNTARWLGLLYPGDGVQNCCLLHRKILYTTRIVLREQLDPCLNSATFYW